MNPPKPKESNPFIRTRQTAESQGDAPQALNRLWWEEMPMTYADWEADERDPESDDDFAAIESYLFAHSPFLRERFDFEALAGKQLLDLGCGSGVLSCRHARAGAQVTSIDLTETGVAMTKRNLASQGLRASVVRGDAEGLPFADASFDYIFSWGVLHHTGDIAKAVSEAGRVLAPKGRGLMMVYHRFSVVYYVLGLYWLLAKGKLFQGHSLKSVQDFYTDGYIHRYMTRREVSRLLENAGLRVHRFTVTQYQKKILPGIPRWLDEWMKAHFGMCLIAEFEKP